MEEKPFTAWSDQKRCLDKKAHAPQFREREVWWCAIGVNIGVEENGKNTKYERPIVVIKKFNRHCYFGVPLTSKSHNDAFHVEFNCQNTKQTACISQLRVWSSKRLIRKIGKINTNDFARIRDALIALI